MGPDFPKMATSRGTHTGEYSLDFCLQCPSPTTSHSHPLFSQEILQELHSVLTHSYGASALPWDPVHVEICVPISPSPMELLCRSPTGLQCQMLWGLFLPMPDPQAWGPDVGLGTLTPVGESLWAG